MKRFAVIIVLSAIVLAWTYLPSQAALPVTNTLVCWYDAAVGVTTNSSGVIQTWADQSGNGHNGSVGGGNTVLALNQQNSLPAAQFRTSWLNVPGSMFTAEQYLVLRAPGSTWIGTGCFMGPTDPTFTGAGEFRYWRIYDMRNGDIAFWPDPAPFAVSKNGAPVAPQWGDNFVYPIPPINQYMILKIDVNTSQYVGAQSPANYQIGKGADVGTVDFDVTEIIGYSNTLSTAEENKIGGYLAAKYAISTVYPPLAPAGLTAVSPATGVIALKWTAAWGATGYKVKRSLTSSAETFLTTASTTNYNDTAITMGMRYYYVVTSTNIYGESANSLEVSSVAPSPGLFITLR